MPFEVIMPQMGESITEGTLTRWLKAPGESVERDENLFEISTDKVDTEVPSPAAGVLLEIRVKEGETVPVGTLLCTIDSGTESPAVEGPAAAAESAPPAFDRSAAAAEPPATPQAPAAKTGERSVRSSPLVRRIAREHGVDVSLVTGTGLSGRVTKADILAHIDRQARSAVTRPVAGSALAAPRPPVTRGAGSRVETMSVMRKRIAEHMVMSKRTSAHVTTVFEVDMKRVADLRAAHKDSFAAAHGARLTYTAFIARAAVDALADFPLLNASVDGDDIVYHGSVHLGIAVALDWGLIVPVIKSADSLNLVGLARSIEDLANRARAKQLQPDEVQGGTFTFTNPGVYGGQFGTPIINQPQVAILGVGTVEKRPVVIDDAIAIRPRSYFVLSFDHRIIDGATADQFMARVKERIETMEIS